MITVEEYLTACDTAWDRYGEIARNLGDDLVCATPPGVDGINSCFALCAHMVGVVDRWGSTVNLGIAVPRDREAEFFATGTVDEALALIEAGRAKLRAHAQSTPDMRAISANTPEGREPSTCGAVLMHVYQELVQHLGHLEITRDALVAGARQSLETFTT